MITVKELRVMAKKFGLPCTWKLNKAGLIKVIAEARANPFQKRVERARKTGRFPALQGDAENPHKKGQRRR